MKKIISISIISALLFCGKQSPKVTETSKVSSVESGNFVLGVVPSDQKDEQGRTLHRFEVCRVVENPENLQKGVALRTGCRNPFVNGRTQKPYLFIPSEMYDTLTQLGPEGERKKVIHYAAVAATAFLSAVAMGILADKWGTKMNIPTTIMGGVFLYTFLSNLVGQMWALVPTIPLIIVLAGKKNGEWLRNLGIFKGDGWQSTARVSIEALSGNDLSKWASVVLPMVITGVGVTTLLWPGSKIFGEENFIWGQEDIDTADNADAILDPDGLKHPSLMKLDMQDVLERIADAVNKQTGEDIRVRGAFHSGDRRYPFLK